VSWWIHRDPDLGRLQSLWQAAAARHAASVFQTWPLARHWAAAHARDVEFQILCHETPAAVVPWVRRDGTWSLLGEGLFDYLDFIGGPPLPHLALPGPLRVTGVPEATPFRAAWHALGARATPFAAAPVRVPGVDPAHQHKRTAHRFTTAGVELRREDEPRARNGLLDFLFARKAEQFGDAVLDSPARRWLLAMVEGEPQISELWSLRRSGQTIAGLLCWNSPAVRYAYTVAYDPNFAPLSPGILAMFAILRHTMTEGKTFNFLVGEHGFKQRFATGRESLLRFHAQPNS